MHSEAHIDQLTECFLQGNYRLERVCGEELERQERAEAAAG